MEDRQQLLFTKTSLDSSQQRTTPLDASSERLQGAMKPLRLKQASGLKRAMFVEKPDEWVIEPLTPNSLEWLKGVGESFSLPCLVSLSHVLESGPVHQRYFLSEKVCSGILRRVNQKGKRLPELIRKSLEAVVQKSTAATKPGRQSTDSIGKTGGGTERRTRGSE